MTASDDRRPIVALLTDGTDGDDIADRLRPEFDVRLAPSDTPPDAVLGMRPDVVLVDARDEDRLHMVTQVARGGIQSVVVLGPFGRPSEAMRYLDVGALDYITTRTSQIERLARIRSAARRNPQAAAAEPTFDFAGDGLSISLARHEVLKNEQPVRLTPNEFRLLTALLSRPNEVIPHRELMAQVWGLAHLSATHYLRIYIRQLREKLEDNAALPRLILTVWGVGYRIAIEPVSAEDSARDETASASG